MEHKNNPNLPNFFISLVPITLLVVGILCSIKFLDASPHIPILVVTLISVLISMFVFKQRWNDIEAGMKESIGHSMSAIIVLMTVGIVIGTWILSGAVPAMIYYGLKIISPKLFLPCVLTVCSIVSLSIGSSWTTAATVGIAFIGIGTSMGFSLPLTAGAVISGAYFGDKMSPLSDTTNLAPAIAGTNLYTHIRHMFSTTGVTYLICLVLFSIIGLKNGASNIDTAAITKMAADIEGSFEISPALLLIPCFVILLAVLKVPPLLGLLFGSIVAAIAAMIFQGASLAAVVECMHYGYVSETGIQGLDELLSRGGLDSMMWTVSLIIAALMFAGVMEQSRMIESITTKMSTLIRGRGSLVLVTGLSSIGINFATGEQYLSIVIPGRMYKAEFKKQALAPENLSRVVEDCGTITSPLIPWNGCGAFMIATLGLAPWVYVPYCLFNIINPLVSFIFGFTGISMKKLKPEGQEDASETA